MSSPSKIVASHAAAIEASGDVAATASVPQASTSGRRRNLVKEKQKRLTEARKVCDDVSPDGSEVLHPKADMVRMTTEEFRARRAQAVSEAASAEAASAEAALLELASSEEEAASAEETNKSEATCPKNLRAQARAKAGTALAEADKSEERHGLVVMPSNFNSFDPVLVKVKNGVAHIVGRIGAVLVYVETQTCEACGPTKVWLLAHIGEGQKHVKASLDPLMLRVNRHLAPVLAKVGSASVIAKSKVLSVALPLQARVIDGVLHVQGTIGNASIHIQEKVSDAWSTVAAKASNSYTVAYQAGDARVRPVCVWTSSKFCSAKELTLSVTQPCWVRARDGSLYVQAAIGSTLVRMKVVGNERLFAPALSAYTSMHGILSSYTTQVLAKLVSIHNSAKARFHQVLGPYLEKGQSMATYASMAVNDMVVSVKVRVATKRDAAQQCLSTCYVKIQGGVVYVRGMVGDKVVYVKVCFGDLINSLTAKATGISNGLKMRMITATDYTLGTATSVTQFAKSTATGVSTKVGATVTDKNVQVTVVGAVGGGASGLATGTVLGAAVGVVPALFTFGLSIPICAAFGGATGLCAGTVGGGATAWSVNKHKDGIKNGMAGALVKANVGKDYMSKKAKGCTNFVAENTMIMKSRLVGGTGGA